jgi:hypothetical protein
VLQFSLTSVSRAPDRFTELSGVSGEVLRAQRATMRRYRRWAGGLKWARMLCMGCKCAAVMYKKTRDEPGKREVAAEWRCTQKRWLPRRRADEADLAPGCTGKGKGKCTAACEAEDRSTQPRHSKPCNHDGRAVSAAARVPTRALIVRWAYSTRCPRVLQRGNSTVTALPACRRALTHVRAHSTTPPQSPLPSPSPSSSQPYPRSYR